jgi:hypothetical protein
MKAKTKKTIGAVGTAAGIVLVMGIFATNDIVTAMHTEQATPSATASATSTAKPVQAPTVAPTATPSAAPTETATPEPQAEGETANLASVPQAQAPVVPQAVAPKAQAAQTICEEDEPCWDCQTMGNRICGPVVAPVAPVSVPQAPVVPVVPATAPSASQTPTTAPTCTSWNGHSCEPGNPGPTGTPQAQPTFTPCPVGVNNTDPTKCGTVWPNPNPGTPTGAAASK